MDIGFKQRFIQLWDEYFPGADLPIAFYYTDEVCQGELAPLPKGRRCVICHLAQVRNGRSLAFDVDAVGCGGGKRYLGFVQELRPNFEYFLSWGIPREMEGGALQAIARTGHQASRTSTPVRGARQVHCVQEMGQAG